MNDVVLRYVATNGDYLPGVPARDLTADDLARLAGDGYRVEDLTATKLYELAEQPTVTPTAKRRAAKE